MKKKSVLIASILILTGLIIWTLWGNTALEVNEYQITSDKIPEAFSGFRIAQVSDLHNAEFGEGNCKLIGLLSQTDPDMIVLTGDLIDSRQTDIEIALEFAEQAMQISPVYFISGNHEARVREYDDLKMGLVDAGVVVLENQQVQITKEGEHITLIGVDDPSFRTDYLFGDAESVIKQATADLQNETDSFTILLSHRPELFDTYVDSGVDLVFSGHAHGGQFRIPLVGDAGQFNRENTTMIVSRGVGNSIIPVRFNNRPEIIVVTLNAEHR